MGKVVSVEDILAYREAAKKLKELKIDFDRTKLLEDIELCQEIIGLSDYFRHEKEKAGE